MVYEGGWCFFFSENQTCQMPTNKISASLWKLLEAHHRANKCKISTEIEIWKLYSQEGIFIQISFKMPKQLIRKAKNSWHQLVNKTGPKTKTITTTTTSTTKWKQGHIEYTKCSPFFYQSALSGVFQSFFDIQWHSKSFMK